MRSFLKNILKENSMLLNIAAFVYNLIFCPKIIYLSMIGKAKMGGAFLRGCKITVRGNNSSVEIGSRARLRHCEIYVSGNNCILHVGGGRTSIKATTFYLEDDKSSIFIDKHFTMESGHIAATEGREIRIGSDCMFSNDVEIRNGDSHPIYSLDENRRINEAQDVKIGDNVWLAAHVRVLKGSIIPNGCIVANSAIVSKMEMKGNAVYGGMPVRILKDNVSWRRERN